MNWMKSLKANLQHMRDDNTFTGCKPTFSDHRRYYSKCNEAEVRKIRSNTHSSDSQDLINLNMICKSANNMPNDTISEHVTENSQINKRKSFGKNKKKLRERSSFIKKSITIRNHLNEPILSINEEIDQRIFNFSNDSQGWSMVPNFDDSQFQSNFNENFEESFYENNEFNNKKMSNQNAKFEFELMNNLQNKGCNRHDEATFCMQPLFNSPCSSGKNLPNKIFSNSIQYEKPSNDRRNDKNFNIYLRMESAEIVSNYENRRMKKSLELFKFGNKDLFEDFGGQNDTEINKFAQKPTLLNTPLFNQNPTKFSFNFKDSTNNSDFQLFSNSNHNNNNFDLRSIRF